MFRISLSTLFGVLAGVGIVGWGIHEATDRWQIFLSFSSFAIVTGGTVTAAFIGYRWRYIWRALIRILSIFIRQPITPQTLVNDVKQTIEWNQRVRNEGKAAFAKIAEENSNEFIQYVFNLVSTGYSDEEVYLFAQTSIEENYFRHLTQTNILSTMASSAPAFGMVGTLIGLIVMLGKMEDPSSMGPGLSMALLTTLYGVLLARFIFAPTSTKTRQILSIQRFREYLILEGIMLVMRGKSDFYVQDRMNSFLDRRNHYDMTAGK